MLVVVLRCCFLVCGGIFGWLLPLLVLVVCRWLPVVVIRCLLLFVFVVVCCLVLFVVR